MHIVTNRPRSELVRICQARSEPSFSSDAGLHCPQILTFVCEYLTWRRGRYEWNDNDGLLTDSYGALIEAAELHDAGNPNAALELLDDNDVFRAIGMDLAVLEEDYYADIRLVWRLIMNTFQ